MSIRRVKYLDLDVEACNKYIRNFNRKFRLKCHCQSENPHDLHSDQPILNTLVDLIITLALKLEDREKDANRLITRIIDRTIKIEEKLDNVEYIKSQNNDLYNKLKAIGQQSSVSISHSKQLKIEALKQIGSNDSKVKTIEDLLQNLEIKIESIRKLLEEIKHLTLS